MKKNYQTYLLSYCLFIICLFINSCSPSLHKAATDQIQMQTCLKNDSSIKDNRMLIWKSSIDLKVDEIKEATLKIEQIVKCSNGYIESNSVNLGKSAYLTVRIPYKKMHSMIDDFSKIGEETDRNISSEDVTDEFIDTEARLKNAKKLRERLKILITKAKNVKDILEVERELNRVQSDIESMEGRIKRLKSQIDFALINISLEIKTKLGPIGYLIKGTREIIKKLFVLN